MKTLSKYLHRNFNGQKSKLESSNENKEPSLTEAKEQKDNKGNN